MNGSNQTSKSKHASNVMEIQRYLRRIADETGGIPRVFPDGIYGPETTQAVIEFQQAYGLPVTGVIDLDTWNALHEENERIVLLNREPLPVYIYPSKDLVVGLNNKSDVVYVIQIMLNALSDVFENIPEVKVSGIYDLPTQNAVREFQSTTSGNVTGNVDKSTWDYLTKVHNEYRNNGE